MGKRKELARIFGRYFEVDDSFVKASNLIGLARTGLFLANEKAPVNEVRFPAYESENPSLDSYLYVKDSALRKTFDEFMTGRGSSNPRRVTETTKVDRAPAKPSKKRNKPSAVKGLEEAPAEGENMAVIAESQGKLGFPFYFPALRKTGSRYSDPQPRIYTIRDGQNKAHKAYRLVLYSGAYGEYYGVQGMAWKYPPILDDPDSTRAGQRPPADALLRRQPPAPRGVAHAEGRLLDHEHADDVDPEQPSDRHRRVAAPPEVLVAASGACASRSRS